jgi:hypothetical protein
MQINKFSLANAHAVRESETLERRKRPPEVPNLSVKRQALTAPQSSDLTKLKSPGNAWFTKPELRGEDYIPENRKRQTV